MSFPGGGSIQGVHPPPPLDGKKQASTENVPGAAGFFNIFGSQTLLLSVRAIRFPKGPQSGSIVRDARRLGPRADSDANRVHDWSND